MNWGYVFVNKRFLSRSYEKRHKRSYSRGSALHVLFLESFDGARPVDWAKINIVLQIIVCKSCRKADIQAKGLMITD